MRKMKHLFIFIANDISRIKRGWRTLPLLFIFPLIFIGILVGMVASVIDVDGGEPLKVGLVNLDDSDETSMFVSSLGEVTDVADGMNLVELSKDEAAQGIEDNELAGYIVFPEAFFTSMIESDSSELEVVGNPDMQIESHVVSEIIDTVVRHIRNAQANIMTINHYAHQFDMDDETRHNLIFELFIDYFMQVLSSDVMVDDTQVDAGVAAEGSYFIVNGIFIIITWWVLITYLVLNEGHSNRMLERMKMFGATDFIIAVSKVCVTAMLSFIISAIFIILMIYLVPLNLPLENMLRILTLTLIYIINVAMVLQLCEWLFKSEKMTLLLQVSGILSIVFFAGAIIPKVYFPFYSDPLFDVSFSYQALDWMEEIVLNNRFTMEFDVLIITFAVLSAAMLTMGIWKERRSS